MPAAAPAARRAMLHTACPHYWRYAEPGESERAIFPPACAARAGCADPRRGAGDGRRLHRRAGDGHRRHHPAAGRLLGGDPGGAARARRAPDRRRGGHRLRPHGRLFRLAHLRHRAGPHHHRQGTSTSAYLPLSGVIVGERVWKVLEEGNDKLGPFGHGWTYSRASRPAPPPPTPISTSSTART